jgi:hypothetical protein
MVDSFSLMYYQLNTYYSQKIQSFLKSVRDGLQSVVDLQEGSTKQSINEVG